MDISQNKQMTMQLIGYFLPLLFFAPANTQAHDLSPHFNGPIEEINTTSNKTVVTKESIVSFNGSKYREIEYKGEKFYLRFRNKEATLQDEAYCLKQGQNDPLEGPYLVLGGAEIAKRTELFIEGIRVKCQSVDLDFMAGISHRGEDGTKTSLQINPFTQALGLSLGGSGASEKNVTITPSG